MRGWSCWRKSRPPMSSLGADFGGGKERALAQIKGTIADLLQFIGYMLAAGAVGFALWVLQEVI